MKNRRKAFVRKRSRVSFSSTKKQEPNSIDPCFITLYSATFSNLFGLLNTIISIVAVSSTAAMIFSATILKYEMFSMFSLLYIISIFAVLYFFANIKLAHSKLTKVIINNVNNENIRSAITMIDRLIIRSIIAALIIIFFSGASISIILDRHILTHEVQTEQKITMHK